MLQIAGAKGEPSLPNPEINALTLPPSSERQGIPALEHHGAPERTTTAYDRVEKHWRELLGRYQSTKDLNEMLGKKDVTFQFVDSSEWNGGALFGESRGDTVLINRTIFDKILEKLEKSGATPDEAEHQLALSTLSIVAHELQHTATARKIVEKLGAPMTVNSVEEEFIAHARGVKVALEVTENGARLVDDILPVIGLDRPFLEAWRNGGFSEVDKTTAMLRGVNLSLRSPDPKTLRLDVLKRVETQIKELDSLLSERTELQKLADNPPPGHTKAEFMTELKSFPSLSAFQNLIKLSQESLPVLRDPEKFERLVGIYRDAYKELGLRFEEAPAMKPPTVAEALESARKAPFSGTKGAEMFLFALTELGGMRAPDRKPFMSEVYALAERFIPVMKSEIAAHHSPGHYFIALHDLYRWTGRDVQALTPIGVAAYNNLLKRGVEEEQVVHASPSLKMAERVGRLLRFDFETDVARARKSPE